MTSSLVRDAISFDKDDDGVSMEPVVFTSKERHARFVATADMKAKSNSERRAELAAAMRAIKPNDFVSCEFTVNAKKLSAVLDEHMLSHKIKQSVGADVVVAGLIVWQQYEKFRTEKDVRSLKIVNPLDTSKFVVWDGVTAQQAL